MSKKIVALALTLVMACAAFAGCAPTETGKKDESSTTNTSSSVSSEESKLDSSASSDSSIDAEPAGTGMYPGTPDEDMITVNIQQEPPRMNTLLSTDAVSFMVMKNIYENLTRLDENDEVTPGAAESWDISDDKLTYTFHLQEGMVWTNGDAVTAKDFEFAWKELLNPETAAEYAYFLHEVEGAKAYTEGTGSRDDIKITAVDDLTLEVVLTQPTEYFLSKTTFGSLCPINQKFYEEVGADKYGTEAEYILSNGPFTMDSWVHESEIILVKNEDYFNADSIKLPKIKMLMLTDTNAVVNSFMANELDMSILTLGTQVQQVQSTGYETLKYDDGGSFYLEMNQENEVLANLNIRKAIATAIDREAFVATVLQGSSKPSVNLVPPTIHGQKGPFNEEIQSPWMLSGDAVAAKELFDKGLEELGMTAEEASKKVTLVADDGDAAVTMAAFFKEQLNSKLGFDLVVENMPFMSRIERVSKQDFSMYLGGWAADYNDPNSFLDLFVTGGGNNHTGFSNEEYDKLIADAALETDTAKRMEMFYRIEEIIAENAVIAPIYHRVRDYVVSEKVEGIYRTAFQDIMFINAYIK